MAHYRYKAVSPAGEAQEGEMEGAAPAAVVARLQDMGLIPIRVEVAQAGTLAAAATRPSLLSWRRAETVGQEEVAVFTQELATLLQAGLPLDRALDILIGLATTPAVQTLLIEVRDSVRGGSALSVALEAHGAVFSRFYLNMIRAGEAGGALGEVLARLSEFIERARALRETVKSALVYPVILVGVSVLSVVILLVWVVPQFSQMFEDSGQVLPLATRIVIGLGELFQGYWWAFILGGIALYKWFERQLAESGTRLKWDARFLSWPLLGDLVTKIEVARFARTLGTLTGNGVALLTALAIARETLGNSVLAASLAGVVAKLKEGKGLGQPLMETGLFPKLAVHMVQVGEETGRLQDMLLRIADVYDREVQGAVKRMLSLLEPVLILGLGLVIGGIIMSVLVAILSVNDLAM